MLKKIKENPVVPKLILGIILLGLVVFTGTLSYLAGRRSVYREYRQIDSCICVYQVRKRLNPTLSDSQKNILKQMINDDCAPIFDKYT